MRAIERRFFVPIAIRGIGRIGGPEARAALETLVRSRDREVAVFAAEALKILKQPPVKS
jgi:hypothetical protein